MKTMVQLSEALCLLGIVSALLFLFLFAQAAQEAHAWSVAKKEITISGTIGVPNESLSLEPEVSESHKTTSISPSLSAEISPAEAISDINDVPHAISPNDNLDDESNLLDDSILVTSPE